MNYKDIIKKLDDNKIIDMMKKLGVTNYIEKDDYIIFPTICHNINIDEASMKLYFYKDTKLFMCYTEDGAMSIFKFLKNYYTTRQIDYDWYSDIYNLVVDCSNYFSFNDNFCTTTRESLKDKYLRYKESINQPNYSAGLLDIFVKTYPSEWLQDGINKETMDKYNIRYSISQNKIIIPHYDVEGNLIGIRGRTLNEWEEENIGKYMPIQIEQKWYAHKLSLNLYGLNYNRENIKRYGICYIGEAEKFCLQCDSFSFPNCSVAVCGSQFNKYQLQLLLKYCQPREIVLCFDQEEKQGEDKYFFKLWNMGKKYLNYCNVSFIYDTKNLLDLKDSPSDKGESVFKQLLERRVKIR